MLTFGFKRDVNPRLLGGNFLALHTSSFIVFSTTFAPSITWRRKLDADSVLITNGTTSDTETRLKHMTVFRILEHGLFAFTNIDTVIKHQTKHFIYYIYYVLAWIDGTYPVSQICVLLCKLLIALIAHTHYDSISVSVKDGLSISSSGSLNRYQFIEFSALSILIDWLN